MIAYARLALIFVFSAADAFFGFAFYFRLNKYELFGRDLFNYNFAHTMFEFWLFSMLRVVILVSATFGLIINPKESLPFLKKLRYPIGVLNILVVLCSVAKIMLYTEYLDGNHDDDPWFLTLGAWTIVASLIMYVLWNSILQEAFPPPDSKESILDAETVKLINKGGRDVKNERITEIGCKNTSNHNDDNVNSGGEFENMSNLCKWYTIIRLVSYSKQDWPFLFVGIIALVCTSISSTFLPILAGQAVDGVVIWKKSAEFHKTIALMALVSILVSTCSSVGNVSIKVSMARLNRRITTCLFYSILKQDMNFFEENEPGAILSRLTSDTVTISDSLGESFRISLLKVFQIVTTTVAMVTLSWRLSVITTIALLFLSVITDAFGTYYDNLTRKVQNALADANIIAEETISTIKTVRSFAMEAGEKSTYRERLDTVYHLRKREALLVNFTQLTVSTFLLVTSIMIYLYGGHLVIRGKITGGTLVSYVLCQKKIGASLGTLNRAVSHLMKAAGASGKVFELIDLSPNSFRKDDPQRPRELEGRIQFKDVTFAYPTRHSNPALRNVSFTATPGKMLAIVGPSGGGKSSCIGLLQHFYEPKSGEILLDGNNIKDYSISYLNKRIVFVGQEPVIYAKTLKDNISYGLENCSLERIHDAAKQVNIHDFIIGLKKGYETEVGEKGVRLSGGQKQRVALARALLRDPKILILDGATSALDPKNEHLVLEAILNKLACFTVIIVTDCLSTIKKADRIVVIDDGRVVEQGSHQELINTDRVYTHFVRHRLRWKMNKNISS